MMITKDLLDQAKAFLCWDVFPDISIQLVEMKTAVSYYYPPSDRSTIVVYYERGSDDFSLPLIFLFHEAGHHLQYLERKKTGGESEFWERIDIPTGPFKAAFEQESWNRGRVLFETFVQTCGLDESQLKRYDSVAGQSIESYR